MVDSLGLVAIALSQLLQSLTIVVVGWCFIHRLEESVQQRAVSWVPVILNKRITKEVLGYGSRIQGLNVASFVFDPITKFTLSAVAGVTVLGVYELASRTVLQLRSLVITPAQNLVPVYAAIPEDDSNRLTVAYNSTFSTLIAISTPLMGALVLGSPVISYFWLGRFELDFTLALIALSIAWLVNIYSVPSYMLGIARGSLRWNVIAAIIMAACTPVALILSATLDKKAAIPAIALIVTLSAVVTIFGNSRMWHLHAFPPHSVIVQVYARWLRRVRRFVVRGIDSPGGTS
jgi:O-antigen/teichoic acid export membrane protein